MGLKAIRKENVEVEMVVDGEVSTILVQDVLFVPGIIENLLSVRCALRKGCNLHFLKARGPSSRRTERSLWRES